MNCRLLCCFCLLWLTCGASMEAAADAFEMPKTVKAGSAFSVSTAGKGKALFYIVGPGQVLCRTVRLGESIAIEPGKLQNAGHYLVILAGPSSTDTAELDVTAGAPAGLSFLAKPSRLPVNERDGISAVAYVFDAFHNLVVKPTSVEFRLAGNARGGVQSQTVWTRHGVAWVRMNSASGAGTAQVVASAGGITETRVVQQVPGDPCHLRITAQASGSHIILETDPVRDCSGNPVPDGTIVTFTETYEGKQSTVDVPLKRGVAKTELPAHDGAVVSVATGVVMGNEIHWGGAR